MSREDWLQLLATGNAVAAEWWIRTRPPEPPRTVLGQTIGTDLSRPDGGTTASLLVLAIAGVVLVMVIRR